MNIRALENIWGQAGLPVVVFASSSDHHVVYENAQASALSRGDIFSTLSPQDAQALREFLTGKGQRPLFCQLGNDVFSAVLLSFGAYCVCLFNPVTEYYNRTQSALDKAIMASRAKTNFLSEMSHDIRTPMGAIVGLTEVALSQTGTPLKVTECLKKIKVASGHMMSLLNEVLDMSRIESGRVLIQTAQTNIADLLHEILIVAKPQADTGGLEFRLEMGPVDCESIMADAVRVKQVCLNLLSNAIKYTPAGGWVELFFQIASAGDKANMTVRVTDNGMGMSPEFLTKVFSPFEREEKAAVHKIQGTGLGMAITKNLVELMGGSIAVTSQLDQGSCFTVEIPFDLGEQNQDSAGELAGRHVLLMDSDEKQAALTVSMLNRLGVKVHWAKDAESAVMNLNDAGISGLEYYAILTAERLEGAEMTLFLPDIRRRLGSGLPILLLTASDWSQIEYVFTRAGADGFIPLPLFQSRLAAGLLACAGGTGPAEPAAETLCDLSGRKLLLAEDNELNREIAVELIGETGALIECAENGQQAVEKFSASAPGYYDVILMDIQMPILNGLDATRKIRSLARPDAKEVPIIAMTANAFVEDVKNSLDAGMDAHISKPLDMDRVFSTIETLLRGRRG